MTEKNKGGRPPMFHDPQELEALINEYFDKGGHFTITGLCLYCGFDSRQSFYDYEKKPQFTYIIKRARLMIEHGYEKALMSDKVTGPIFALKNMGWSDRQEIDHTTMGGSIASHSVTITPNMSPTEAAKAYQDLMGD